MKAAVLKAFGSPLAIETMPEPVLGTGEVIVDVVASRVLAYANEVFSGERKYLLELPIVPGPARSAASAPSDRTRPILRAGDWVYCDPTVRSRDDALLARHHPAGPDRRQRRRPAAAAIFPRRRLGRTDARADRKRDSDRRHRRGRRRALVRARHAAGALWRLPRRAICSPAKPCWSTAPPAVSAARRSPSRSGMGAACVIATGRNETALADLARRFGARVRTVTMRGERGRRPRRGSCRPRPARSTACSTSCRRRPTPTQVRTAILAVRPYGRVVLMGGVGMLGGAGLDLPYPWMMRNCITLRGQWMYPPHATILMVGLIRAGLVRLDQFAVTAFDLDRRQRRGRACRGQQRAVQDDGDRAVMSKHASIRKRYATIERPQTRR